MKLLQKSLRQKVLLGYVMGMALMLGVAFVNWHYLNNLEHMIQSGENVSRLFETTLEIRRFEKNYFLYGKEVDYDSLLSFVATAQDIMRRKTAEIEMFAEPAVVSKLSGDITGYMELLKSSPRTPELGGSAAWEKKIREKGKSIVTVAEDMSRNERKIMQSTLQSSRQSLLMSVVFITSVWFLSGAMFFRMFLRPLGELERHMKKVADGQFSFIPIKSQDREIVSLNSAFNRMLSEIEWRQSHVVQSEKLASLGTLLFGVAHELNNPLSNISTSTEILSEELEEADMDYKRELLGQIGEETDRAKDIVRSLLDYSRSGKKEMINLKKAVDESIRFIKGDAPAKVEISVSVPEGITIFADKQRLQQVFLNLVKNGIDAMVSESGKITITAREVKGPAVEIRVSDTGSGMEQEIVSKIFDPFFTTKETRKGYGLGLFIVHHIIVDEHGGSIDVESSPGRGTTFMITLPEKEQGT
jgi:two-component system NtrC family sensor kinase